MCMTCSKKRAECLAHRIGRDDTFDGARGIVATLIGRSNRAFDAPDAMASSVPVALLSRVDVMILRSSANAADLRATVA